MRCSRHRLLPQPLAPHPLRSRPSLLQPAQGPQSLVATGRGLTPPCLTLTPDPPKGLASQPRLPCPALPSLLSRPALRATARISQLEGLWPLMAPLIKFLYLLNGNNFIIFLC